MGDFAVTDVTVTLPDRDRDVGHGAIMKNITIASIAFGDGSLTYATGGVPLPAKEQFGFQHEIQFCAVEPDPDDGFVYKYDSVNHKLMIYTQGATTGSTTATTAGNGALVEDSFAAETAVRFANSAVDTTYDLGQLIELPNGSAPAATTARLLLVGE